VLGPPPACDAALAAVRDALLGTVVATEVVKRMLALGTPLGGRVLTWDPAGSGMVLAAVATSGCATCATATG
jgi:hypothetical protein